MLTPEATFSPDFFNSSPFGFFISNPEGRFLFANPALAAMLGHETPEALITSVTDIATQVYASAEERGEFMRLMQKHGKIVDHEIRLKRKDGSIIWVSRSAQAVFDDQSTIIQYQGVNTDITHRKRTEQELEEKTALLEAILDNTPDFMSVKRPDLSVVRYNKTGCAFVNKSQEQVEGAKCYELLGRDTPCQPCAAQEAIRSRQPVALEKYVPELEKHLHCRTSLIFSPEGGVAYVVELIQDITQRKQIEKTLT